jgi:hypothetical protein
LTRIAAIVPRRQISINGRNLALPPTVRLDSSRGRAIVQWTAHSGAEGPAVLRLNDCWGILTSALPGFSSDLNHPSLVKDPESSYRSGELSINGFLIFFRVKENGSKRKRPCPACPCASSRRPEHAETRPAFAQATAGLRKVRALYSVRPADARRGTKGNQKSKEEGARSKAPSRGYLRPPDLREKIHFPIVKPVGGR